MVFNLKPPTTACKSAVCPWTETVLYSFSFYDDGSGLYPEGELRFDAVGNLYGVTDIGGEGNCYGGCGVAYKLARSGSNWTLSAAYYFQGAADGGEPNGLIFDSAGNLYGTAALGGSGGGGTVFELTPSGTTFTENTLYSFATPNGSLPQSGLTFDSSGNLYGSTGYSSSFYAGTIFGMTPSDSGWNLTTLYTLPSQYGGPYLAPLVIDGEGDLLGTSADFGGSGQGGVFKLTNGSGGWSFTSLYSFTGGSDGGQPVGSVVLDTNGSMYGVASSGGSQSGICSESQHTGCGTVWEITP